MTKQLTQQMLDDMVARELGIGETGDESEKGKKIVKDRLMNLARGRKAEQTKGEKGEEVAS